MADQNLPPLDWRVPIVHSDGTPTDAFERAWNNQRTLNGGAVVDFTDLADVPSAYTTKAGYAVRVNAGASGLEFATQSTMLDGIGLTRGAILERGASGWQIISPGAANTLLTSAGAGSDPAWQALSAIIDAAIGSTRGAVLFRGASGWAILGPGTAGNFLQTAGAGADPLWAAASGGAGGPSPYWATVPTVPTVTPFTLVQGVGGSATMTNSTRGVKLAITGAGAVDRNALMDIASPGATFTITALLVCTAAQRSFISWGLYAKDGTGKIQAFVAGSNVSNNFRDIRWTNLTTFSTSVDRVAQPQSFSVMWTKLVLDATNLTYSVSVDGENFIPIYQVAKGAFLGTVTNCGVWFGVNQQAAPQNITEFLHLMSWTATTP